MMNCVVFVQDKARVSGRTRGHEAACDERRSLMTETRRSLTNAEARRAAGSDLPAREVRNVHRGVKQIDDVVLWPCCPRQSWVTTVGSKTCLNLPLLPYS